MTSAAEKIQSGASGKPYRVMLVDDSAVIRGLFRRTLEPEPLIEIVASVSNGQQAIDALQREKFEVIVLDIEMPVMDGLTALPQLLKIDPDVKVVMASTLTQQNADISMKSLALGATDYIPKPTARHEIHSAEDFKRELLEKVKALGFARRKKKGEMQPAGDIETKAKPATATKTAAGASAQAPIGGPIKLRKASTATPEVLVIGSSTGGPPALMNVLGRLRGGVDMPILITQHMPKTFTAILGQHLSKTMGLPGGEGVDGEEVTANRIYVAPGGYHMLVRKENGKIVIRLDDGPPENFCKPAVDPMLRSVAEVYGPKALVTILTGMGYDGLAGGRYIVQTGGTIIAQDENSSVVWGMPGAVATGGLCSAVMPLDEIATKIRRLAGKPDQ